MDERAMSLKCGAKAVASSMVAAMCWRLSSAAGAGSRDISNRVFRSRCAMVDLSETYPHIFSCSQSNLAAA